MDPWSVKVVTPSESLIAHFDKWDMTKSNASKLRSFNRARKWISNLLKRQFKVPEAHKLRHIDTMNALQHMIDSTAMPGGMSYEDSVVVERFLTLSGLESFVRTNTYVTMNLMVNTYVYL